MSSELTEFLTLRRGRIAPQSVGLNRSKARRSKGLTREDMAELSGVSFKWYTLFESGAGRGVSVKLAARVADVLGLSAAERHYLFGLLGFADAFASAVPDSATAGLTRLMHQMDSVAAALFSPVLDVLDCNQRYAEMFPAPDASRPFGRNALWRLFNDDSYRAAWVDWPAAARRAVADFRYISASVRETVGYTALHGALEQNDDFNEVWRSEDSFPQPEASSRFGLVIPGGQKVLIEALVLRSIGVTGIHLGTLTLLEAPS